ncbi:hypothetical protein [Eubacterium ramulus]|uniref:hypothetical protein n=1 Tax=Eubacterium ramulus TaxID=39490 RepID=UPI00352226BE
MALLTESASGISTAFDTAIKAIQSDTNGMISTALPIALGIAGIFIAVKLGIKFFRSVAK